MKRSVWMALSLVLLVSCNGESPNGVLPSAGDATLVFADARVDLLLRASTTQASDSRAFSDRTPGAWMGQPMVRFDDASDVHVHGAGGAASAEATLGAWASGLGAGDVTLGGQLTIDVLGSATDAGNGDVQSRFAFNAIFEVAGGAMYYELLIDHESSIEPGTSDSWHRSFLLQNDAGQPVFSESESGAALGSRVLTGTLPTGRYRFSFSLQSASNINKRAAARSSGDGSFSFFVN